MKQLHLLWHQLQERWFIRRVEKSTGSKAGVIWTGRAIIAPVADLPPGYELPSSAPIPENQQPLLAQPLERWGSADNRRYGRWVKFGNSWHRLESSGTVYLDGVRIIDADG